MNSVCRMPSLRPPFSIRQSERSTLPRLDLSWNRRMRSMESIYRWDNRGNCPSLSRLPTFSRFLNRREGTMKWEAQRSVRRRGGRWWMVDSSPEVKYPSRYLWNIKCGMTCAYHILCFITWIWVFDHYIFSVGRWSLGHSHCRLWNLPIGSSTRKGTRHHQGTVPIGKSDHTRLSLQDQVLQLSNHLLTRRQVGLIPPSPSIL